MDAWMVYGPFDLSDATTATLDFALWLDTEVNYDYFMWGASADGTNFDVGSASGSSSDAWVSAGAELDDYCGDSTVWIAFRFVSDSSSVDRGAYVDGVEVEKNVGVPTALSLTRSVAVAPYNGLVTFVGDLRETPGNTVLGGSTEVGLWRLVSGNWSRCATATWDPVTQRYKAYYRVVRNTTFSMYFPGDFTYRWADSNSVLVKSRASVGKPAVPVWWRSGRTYRVYGFTAPQHGGYTSLYWQAYYRGAWRNVPPVNRLRHTYFNSYKSRWGYNEWVSGPHGQRWRVRAYHADADHYPTYSGWSYFRVN
jgi:hypothetical protein